MGRIAGAEGDPQGAVTLLDKAGQFYRPGFFPDVRPIAAMKARVWISYGNLSQATDWARERGVCATGEAGYLSEFDHLTVVRLFIARHRVHPDTGAIDQAVRLVDGLLEAAETSGRAGSLVEIRMLQALAQDARGDRPQAPQSLGRAWADAPEPDSYVRLFLEEEGAPMMSLLRDAQHDGLAGDHARRLLSLNTSPEPEDPDAGQRPTPSSPESLSDGSSRCSGCSTLS